MMITAYIIGDGSGEVIIKRIGASVANAPLAPLQTLLPIPIPTSTTLYFPTTFPTTFPIRLSFSFSSTIKLTTKNKTVTTFTSNNSHSKKNGLK